MHYKVCALKEKLQVLLNLLVEYVPGDNISLQARRFNSNQKRNIIGFHSYPTTTHSARTSVSRLNLIGLLNQKRKKMNVSFLLVELDLFTREIKRKCRSAFDSSIVVRYYNEVMN